MTAAEEFLHLQNSEAKVSNVKALSKDSLLGEEQWPEFVSNASTNIDFSRTMSFNKLQPNSAEDESFQMRSGPQQKPLFDFDTGKVINSLLSSTFSFRMHRMEFHLIRYQNIRFLLQKMVFFLKNHLWLLFLRFFCHRICRKMNCCCNIQIEN